jgi:hypothetical protein
MVLLPFSLKRERLKLRSSQQKDRLNGGLFRYPAARLTQTAEQPDDQDDRQRNADDPK